MSQRNIGIMGGTFDPIHIGHLIIAEEARDFLDLCGVIFVPTGPPPHKEVVNVTKAFHRYNMTKLAIKNNTYFSISDIETKRCKTSYTIDTIKKFREIYKDSQFFFIIGGDSIINIHKWKDYDELFKICKFAVAKRAGIPGKEVEEKIKKINKDYGKVIYEIPVPFIDISSTEIRAKVGQDKTIKYYVPQEVEDYILDNNLYKR